MTRSLLISALRQGQTGDEILSILDALANDTDADVMGGYAALSDDEDVAAGIVHMPILNQSVPTLEEISF